CDFIVGAEDVEPGGEVAGPTGADGVATSPEVVDEVQGAAGAADGQVIVAAANVPRSVGRPALRRDGVAAAQEIGGEGLITAQRCDAIVIAEPIPHEVPEAARCRDGVAAAEEVSGGVRGSALLRDGVAVAEKILSP